MILYVVFGMSGDFSDRSEWVVCYRKTEYEAKTVRDQCVAEAEIFYRNHPEHARDLKRDVQLNIELERMFDAAFDWIGISEYVVVPISNDPRELYRYNQMRGLDHELKAARARQRDFDGGSSGET